MTTNQAVQAMRELQGGGIWRRLSPVTRQVVEDVLANRDVLSDEAKFKSLRAVKAMVEADLLNHFED